MAKTDQSLAQLIIEETDGNPQEIAAVITELVQYLADFVE